MVWNLIIFGIPLLNGIKGQITRDVVVLFGTLYTFVMLYIYNQWVWLRSFEDDGTCDNTP